MQVRETKLVAKGSRLIAERLKEVLRAGRVSTALGTEAESSV